MAIIRVGDNYDFNRIQAALDVAEEGDLILIEPGDYTSESTLYMKKPVHIIGNTQDVKNSAIFIRQLYATDTIVSTKLNAIILENLSIITTYYLLNFGATWCPNMDVLINKCFFNYLSPGAGYEYIFYGARQVSFINVEEINRYTTYVASTVTVSYIRSITLGDYFSYSPTYDDHVTKSMIGYGVDYGHSYFKLPTKYYFHGKVTVSGVPVSRRVKAYKRATDILLATAISDATTGEYILYTEYNKAHYLICKDNDLGENYNDLIRGNVIPAEDVTYNSFWENSSYLNITVSGVSMTSDIVNFPILLKLDNSAGITNYDTSIVFNELIDPKHASRMSLQGGSGQDLFCELIKWDVSNKEGLLYASIPYLKAGTDLDLKLYYDREKPDNIFNVGYSVNVAIGHLWDTDSLGIYHLNEDITTTTRFRSSSFKKYDAFSYNLIASDIVVSPLGTALDLSSGYLILDDAINSAYKNDITIMSYVKFNDINVRGTIFSEGDREQGLELGVYNGNLFLALSDGLGVGKKVETTLSGLNLNDYYLITAVVDKDTDNALKLYINDSYVAYTNFEFELGSYIGSDVSTIGTYYLSSPIDVYNPQEGINKFTKVPITLTSSGTVASGTVMLVTTDTTSYYDATNRHTFTPKKALEVYVSGEIKKFGDTALIHSFGIKDNDPIHNYNYIKINNNVEDFGFEANQDFTITTWLHMYIYTPSNSYTYYEHTTILGATNDSAHSCLFLYFRNKKYYNHGVKHTYSLFLTIPNDSGGFVFNDQEAVITSYFKTWNHIALVRKNGTIRLYFNGNEVLNTDYSGKIPDPSECAVDSGMLIMNSDSNYSTYNKNKFAAVNVLEVLKGVARWDGNFNVDFSEKSSPDTFFSGQIDELMLYSTVKNELFIKNYYYSLKDYLITYTGGS